MRLSWVVFIFVCSWVSVARGQTLSDCVQKLLNLKVDPRVVLTQEGAVSVKLHEANTGNFLPLDYIFRKTSRLNGFSVAKPRLLEALKDPSPDSYFAKLIRAFKVKVRFDGNQLQKIPKEGPVLIIANHPLCAVETFALTSLILKVRSDVKLVLAELFKGIEPIQPYAIYANPFSSKTSKAVNKQAIQQGVQWLQEGHVTILHPAGDLSWDRDPNFPFPVDPPWKIGVSLFASRAKPTVIPVFAHGQPSSTYLWIRKIHYGFGALMVLPQINAQYGRELGLAIGDPLSYHDYEAYQENLDKMTQFFREKTYSLWKAPIPDFSPEQ